jgi:hypothetical protein
MESWLRGTTPWAAFHHSDRADYLAAGGTDVSLALGTERLVDTLLAAAIAMALLWTSEWVRAEIS